MFTRGPRISHQLKSTGQKRQQSVFSLESFIKRRAPPVDSWFSGSAHDYGNGEVGWRCLAQIWIRSFSELTGLKEGRIPKTCVWRDLLTHML